jgi:hypothetical protein
VSVLFDDAASQYAEVDNALGVTYPFGMFAWAMSDDLTISQCVMAVVDKDVAAQRHWMGFAGNVAGDPVRAQTTNAGTNGLADSTVGYQANVWHLLVAVFNSATDRRMTLDGGNKGTNATSVTPTGLDRFCIGRRGTSTPDLYLSGRVAECGLTVGYAPTDADIAALYNLGPPPGGRHARAVFGTRLTHYWRLLNANSPSPARVGGVDLTVFNGPVTAAHVKIWHSRRAGGLLGVGA